MRLLLARHPGRLNAPYAIIEDEFITLNRQNRNAAVSTMIHMLRDLHANGRTCQFIKPLQEKLKTAFRVYLAHQQGTPVFREMQDAASHDLAST